MNFLTSCLGNAYGARGDSTKGAKPLRNVGPAIPGLRPIARSPVRTPPTPGSPASTRNPSFSNVPSIVDPSKGAKPVRITGPARPRSQQSPRSHTHFGGGRPSSAPTRRRSPPRSRPACGTVSKAVTSSPRGLRPASPRGGPAPGAGPRHQPQPRPTTPSPRRDRSPAAAARPTSPGRSGGGGRGEDMTRRPSEGGGHGEMSDPFACTHLSELMPVTPLQSTYRSRAGGVLPDGVEGPTSREQNMRRLYVHDEDRVLLKVVHYGNPTSVGIEFEESGEWQFKPMWAQRAGPRAQIYFNPGDAKAAIVTCGGLCPGLNDVIRQIVLTLDTYGVKDILGIQYGFKGFVDPKYPPVTLTRKSVARAHMAGGSFLGVSRGTPDLNDIVDRLQQWNITFFFVIGGNGSHAGAHAIYLKCLERRLKIAVVGIPKTIDNDLQLVDKTFGFDTSVEEAQRAINAGFVEASSAYNGVAIVKLMGRQSGFIAMYATLASGQVDIVLIPEVPFVLDGEDGLYNFMKKRLENNGLCVVVVAEGAGQELLESSGGVDAGGNPILGDIGKWLLGQIKSHFGKIKLSVDVKYIDPTYMIRARTCNSSDHIFCSVLGQNAVHGAFAGYTDITIGLVNTHYVFLPIPKVIEAARMVDPNSNMWHRTVTATGQPDFPTRRRPGISEKPGAPSSPSTKPRPASPGGDSDHTTMTSAAAEGARGQRLSEFSIKIDKNNVQIRSVDSYRQKRNEDQ